jgi:pyruvate ferredoxin oxidoreductase alpha subunit
MVCVDGFTLTHTLEPIELPDQKTVDGFLRPYRFRRSLDPRSPISVGTLVGPDYFPEARHSHHRAMENALEPIERAARDWGELTGRGGDGLVRVEGPEEARTGIIALGSVVGTLADAMETLPGLEPVRLIDLRTFRPFPIQALRDACAGLDRLAVIERALSPGLGGIVGTEVKAALAGPDAPAIYNFAVGLGGRDIPLDILPRILDSLEGEPGFAVLDAELHKLPEEDR